MSFLLLFFLKIYYQNLSFQLTLQLFILLSSHTSADNTPNSYTQAHPPSAPQKPRSQQRLQSHPSTPTHIHPSPQRILSLTPSSIESASSSPYSGAAYPSLSYNPHKYSHSGNPSSSSRYQRIPSNSPIPLLRNHKPDISMIIKAVKDRHLIHFLHLRSFDGLNEFSSDSRI